MAEELDVIRHALNVARERGFAEVSLSFGDTEFVGTLGATPATTLPTPSEGQAVAQAKSDLIPITAPVVGFYREAAQPLTAGQRVDRGSVVAVVAALGLANEVESPISGEVVEVLVQSDQPVEFGQPLALVRSS